MARRFQIEELRISVDDYIHVEWRRAPEYPAPFGSSMAWKRVSEASGARGLIALTRVLSDFLASARSAETSSIHHRIILPMDAYYDPRMDELVAMISASRSLSGAEAISEGKLVVVLQALPQKQPRKPPASPRFPIVVDILGNAPALMGLQWLPEPLVKAARDAGLLHVQSIEEPRQHPKEGQEGSILWVAATAHWIGELRKALVRRSRPPHLLIIELLGSYGEAIDHICMLLAEPLLAAGCSAVAVVTGKPEPGFGLNSSALIQALLRDLPLDRALAEVAVPGNEDPTIFLAAVEGAESKRFLFDAMLEHPNEQGSTLLDALSAPASGAPSAGELAGFLRTRARRAQEEANDAARSADAAVDSDDPEGMSRLAELHERSQRALDKWQRVRDLMGPAEALPDIMLEPFSHVGEVSSGQAVRELPPRHTKVFVTDTDDGFSVNDDAPLAIGGSYDLNVQIGGGDGRHPSVGQLPMEELTRLFQDEEAIDLDILVFAREDAVKLERSSKRIHLPRFGESDLASFPFTILPGDAQATHRRVRIGVYHKNRLLQSVAADLAVADGQKTKYELDYLASDELLTVDQLPSVSLSIFLNDGPDGSHWLGIAGLSRVPVLDLSPAAVEERVRSLRERYSEAQGDGILYSEPLASNSYDWAIRVDEIVELAKLGSDVFFEFITAHPALDGDLKRELKGLLSEPDGLIQIARCRANAPGLPWGTLYDYDLADDVPVRLCEVFEGQLRQNTEDPSGGRHDLLDNPAACAGRPDCPLKGPSKKPPPIVCPFGFWGIRHRIEQPMYHVSPPVPGTATAGSGAPRATWSSVREVQGDGSIASAYWAFPNSLEHLDQLGALAVAHGGTLARTNLEKELDDLYERMTKASIIYFYCHGEDTPGRMFALKVGHEDAEIKLSARTLSHKLKRLERAPLVILNGCGTLAVSPKRIDGLLVVLRDNNASGVVGPEVPVYTSTARLVGEGLIARFLEGEELGRALQAVQRDLMREMNPMGLMYVAYSRADLKFTATEAPESQAMPRFLGDIILE